MKRLALAMAVIFGFAGPALASQCPALMKQIDEALTTASVDAETLAKITELRTAGEAAHAGGDHPASEAALLEALKLLGL